MQGDNIGWDLTARRDAAVHRIEVKGRGPQLPTVHLTANEIRAAQEQAGWELAVVTSALNAPKLSRYTAQEVLDIAVPITYRAELG